MAGMDIELQHSLPLHSLETEDADKRGFNQLVRNVSGRVAAVSVSPRLFSPYLLAYLRDSKRH